MEQIVIQVKNKSKARALINFLKSLEFVENISTSNLPLVQVDPAAEKENDFFALAGLWADRDISLETLRQKAWPGRV